MKFVGCLIAIVLQFSRLQSAAAEELVPLTTEDLSRGFLAEYGATLVEPSSKGAGPKFNFPSDAQDFYVYGIDISHHNFKAGERLDWKLLQSSRVAFVYMKATQGVRYYDKTLEGNWRDGGADAPGVWKGAYHFLSADSDPAAQAENFLNAVEKKTSYASGKDLPPCLDLEWDLATDDMGRPIKDASGKYVDNWKKYTRPQIIAKVNAWLQVVEARLKVRPVVYTNAQWWNSVGLEDDQFLSDRLLWTADYTIKANGNSNPASPPGYRWFLWQFTENAGIGPKNFDGNVSFKNKSSLAKDFGISSQR